MDESGQRRLRRGGLVLVLGTIVLSGCLAADLPGPLGDEETTVPDYEIIGQNNFSKDDVIRIERNVVVPDGVHAVSHQAIRNIARENIDNVTNATAVNAIRVHFYNRGDSFDAAPSARVVWAPDGNLSRAGEVETGDYSRHNVSYERLIGQDVSPAP